MPSRESTPLLRRKSGPAVRLRKRSAFGSSASANAPVRRSRHRPRLAGCRTLARSVCIFGTLTIGKIRWARFSYTCYSSESPPHNPFSYCLSTTFRKQACFRKFGAVRLGRFDDRTPALLLGLQQRCVRPPEQLSRALAVPPVPAHPRAEAHAPYLYAPRKPYRVALQVLADLLHC